MALRLPSARVHGSRGHVANAIGWLTVAIAAAIISLQVAYKQPLASNKPLIDMTSAVILPAGRNGSVFVAPRSERIAGCDSFRIAYH
jgi:hypothetical protein